MVEPGNLDIIEQVNIYKQMLFIFITAVIYLKSLCILGVDELYFMYIYLFLYVLIWVCCFHMLLFCCVDII